MHLCAPLRIHVCMHVHAHLHAPSLTFTHLCAPSCTFTHLHTPLHTFMHARTHTLLLDRRIQECGVTADDRHATTTRTRKGRATSLQHPRRPADRCRRAAPRRAFSSSSFTFSDTMRRHATPRHATHTCTHLHAHPHTRTHGCGQGILRRGRSHS